MMRTRRSPSRSWLNFFCHIIYHFGLVFDGKIDCKWLEVPQGHIGHHGGRRRQGQGGVHWVVNEIIFLSCYTSFQPSFWQEIDCKWFQVPQGHIGHHGGRRRQGQGGVHHVAYEIIFLSCYTSFQPSFWRGIDCKLFQVSQGHVRHHGGCQH